MVRGLHHRRGGLHGGGRHEGAARGLGVEGVVEGASSRASGRRLHARILRVMAMIRDGATDAMGRRSRAAIEPSPRRGVVPPLGTMERGRGGGGLFVPTNVRRAGTIPTSEDGARTRRGEAGEASDDARVVRLAPRTGSARASPRRGCPPSSPSPQWCPFILSRIKKVT